MLSLYRNHADLMKNFWDWNFNVAEQASETSSDFELEVPGVKKENIKIELENGYLSVSWKDRRGADRVTGRTVGRANGVEAKLEDGILTLKLKRPEKQQSDVKWL